MNTETAIMNSVIVAPSQDGLSLVDDLNEAASLPVTSVIDQMLGTSSDHTTKKPVAAELPSPPVKRGRGRPPKNRLPNEPPLPTEKRKRGRPRKNPLSSVYTKPIVVGEETVASAADRKHDKLTVEKMAENLAIVTAIDTCIEQSGMIKQNENKGDNSSAGVNTMNTISITGPKKRGRPRKRPLESFEQPQPDAKRLKEMTSSIKSPQLLLAEKPSLLFSLPECEVTKARVDIDLVEGPGCFQDNTVTTTHTVVVSPKETAPPQTALPPSNTVVKRGRGRPPKKATNIVIKRGRGRPPLNKRGKQTPAISSLKTESPSTGVMKRGRGRPRKHPIQNGVPPESHSQDNTSIVMPVKRKRGRPPKNSVAKQQDVSCDLKGQSDIIEVKRKRGRPRKSIPSVEESIPTTDDKPKRGRGRPRKNRPPSISELAEQILLTKDNSNVDQTGDPLPSVGGVVIQHNERGTVVEKKKRGRPRKNPISSPKPPGVKRGRGRPRIHPIVQPKMDDDLCPPSPVIANSGTEPLVSPMLDNSPLKRVADSLKTSATVAESGNEGFKLHMSFSDSDSDYSEGMGVQDTDIQALAERVTPPSPHPINVADERDSPLLGSRFEESFDEESDIEIDK